MAAAAAAVPPVLAPEGPIHLGPVVDPGPGARGARPVGVDPSTGELDLGALEGDPGLWVVRGEDGLARVLIWSDGRRMVISRDRAGRVTGLGGPGSGAWTWAWEPDGVTVRGPGGGRWRLQRTPAPADEDAAPGAERPVELTVTDALGRTSRSWWEGEVGSSRLLAWEDPLGRRTERAREGSAGQAQRIEDGTGRVWRLRRDGDRASLDTPAGRTWRWTLDGAGRPVRLDDPTGRVSSWRWDEAGRMIEASRGGRAWRYLRGPEGHVGAIEDPAGLTVVLERAATGELLAVSDPLGETLHVERDAAGRIRAIGERDGSVWTIDRDGQGRVREVRDPEGRTLVHERDGAGRLVGLRDSAHGELRLQRDAAGRLTGVTDPEGRQTGLVRDPGGEVVALRRGDASVVELERDALGAVVAVRFSGEELAVRRTPAGLPVQVGEQYWSWDPDGGLVGLAGPRRELELARDGAGRLASLWTDRWWLRLRRDGSSLVSTWEGSDGVVSVGRDLAGRLQRELSEDTEVRLQRDGAGRVFEAAVEELRWRWHRDAAGRVLRVEGPREVSLGLDRDAAGRVRLTRFPDGALLRREVTPGSWKAELVDAGGKLVETLRARLDPRGLPLRVDEGAGSWIWRLDPLGRLVALDAPDGSGWSWSPDGVHAPDEELLLYDRHRWLVEASLPTGREAWGLDDSFLTYLRRPDGQLLQVRAGLQTTELRYDDLGRLTAVDLPEEGTWRVRRDARGRIREVGLGGAGDTLVWLEEDGLSGDRAVLRGPGSTAWVHGPSGPALWVDGEGAWRALVRGVHGGVRWALDSGGSLEALADLPTPLADPSRVGAVGPEGVVHTFEGGPLLREDLACDPLDGRPLHGSAALPWGPWPEPEDPAPWIARSPWSSPLDLLGELGQLGPLAPSPSARAGAATPPSEVLEEELALSWLPAGVQDALAPLGPRHGAHPLDLEPLEWLVVAAALPEGRALSADAVARVLLLEEVPAEDLPPGLSVPGLWWWPEPAGPGCPPARVELAGG